MRHLKMLSVLSVLLVGCVGWLPAALADDINVPFFAGDPNSIVLFADDEGQGLVITGFDVFPGAFPLSTNDCGNGAGAPCLTNTPLNGDFTHTFELPNFVDPLPFKLVRIQVTYLGDSDPIITEVSGFDPECGASPCPSLLVDHVVDTAETEGAKYFFEDWLIVPNPDFDRIVLTAPPGTQVIQVVIDTFSTTSIPLPSTLWLFGSSVASVLGYGWWRGRRGSAVRA